MIKILRFLIFSCIFSLFNTTTALADAFATFPVDVIEELNDGSEPAGCDINQLSGGLPEASFDLDGDGFADICFGSNANTCSGTVNFDCSAASGNSNCSLQTNVEGGFMDGDATAATNNGNPVGPNFDDSPTSITVAIGTPLVVGFQGASTNASLTGYFNFQIDDVDGTNCSYTFGSVYVDDGSEGLDYGDTVGGPSPSATAVPTLSQWGLILLSMLLLGVASVSLYRRKQV